MVANLASLEVEVTRGPLVESRHLVDLAIGDPSGLLVTSFGDVERPVFPRSAVKSLQALPLVESGAADKFGFSDAQIALACSSHNGEAMHVNAATDMLNKAGLTCDDLECGCHAPLYAKASEVLFRADRPVLTTHNNCSGKHSGMLSFAKHAGFETRNYISPDHPVQRSVAGVLESLTGASYGTDNCGTDGCSIPTYAVPLEDLAGATARFATQAKMEKSRAAAAKRILAACCNHPEMVAGSERACTQIMQITGTQASVKMGAEGVYLAMLPEKGLGIALKAHDGATRAAEVAIASVLHGILDLDGTKKSHLAKLASPKMKNHNKIEIGECRLSQDCAKKLNEQLNSV